MFLFTILSTEYTFITPSLPPEAIYFLLILIEVISFLWSYNCKCVFIFSSISLCLFEFHKLELIINEDPSDETAR